MAGRVLDHNQLRQLSDALYETAVQNGGQDNAMSQKELMGLGVIPHNDPLVLLKVIQPLIDQYLFVSLTVNGSPAWKCRSREDAQKFHTLPNLETRLVYNAIDLVGGDGIWTRAIRNQLKMQDTTVKAALKILEQKGYISEMKSVEAPNKKMYIKANLRPSERATGGPWFNDGELDTAFIEHLERVIFDLIKTRSAYESSHSRSGGKASSAAVRVPKKGAVTNGLDPNARGQKRSATDMSGEDTGLAPVQAPVSSRDAKKTLLPLPAGYARYPTVSEIARAIHEGNITKNTTLSEHDVQQLVDVLVFDGLVEPIRVGKRNGYRVVRAMRQDPISQVLKKEREGGIPVPKQTIGPEPLSNGLMEAPCGRCPVFDLCEEGGPVNPANCVYFEKWLDTIT